VRLLLDTHAFLWFLSGDTRLARKVLGLLDEPAHDVFVSGATAWEISTKVALGKMPQFAGLPGQILAVVRGEGFKPLSISIDHADRAGALPRHHRDPFDRMLIAQAQLEGLTLVSNERVFDRYGINRVW
jgi:PIN domain nuclease of toxin-antitoxin system